MTIDLEHIRSRNPIEDVVAERFALKKSGARFVGVEHDSLVVTPANGMYFWNSRSEHGDVFDFVGRYHLPYGSNWNNRDASQFMESVEYLARRGGITIQSGSNWRQSPGWAERQLVKRLHEALLETPQALSYATNVRGWDMQTIRTAQLGFMPQNKALILDGLNLSDAWRGIVNKFPADMLVYIHLERGRLTYLSGRSIVEKKHYNPPKSLAGEKRPYYNAVYNEHAEQVVLVEGQADAVTFGAWGIPAVAIAGMSVQDFLVESLRKHRRVFVALDNTEEARAKSLEVAKRLDGKAHVPQLPEGVKDANEWLVKHKATAEDAARLLNTAPAWLHLEIERVGNLEGLARQDAVRELFEYAVKLDTFAFAEFKQQMSHIGIKGQMFNDLARAARLQAKQQPKRNDVPDILSDNIPLLSPALGFLRDTAMVTVTMIERMKGNRLRLQPYLVTSTRELRRLSDEQVITVNGREVALRAIPEGSEFLMRWRHSDLQRYLTGDTVQPGDVFNNVHNLLKQYIDFYSPIESRILTLWTIGTYFYTMFPAYPYLVLNGPKNSGKSTVLRLLQPLAFNMITTSDPTGPSMFRLIHYTSCTVGIDEAERYHNPRDPGMQQIRQLLNSGYKHGMPAIRVTGDDLKPQAFDVYSPKILAAIMGLEDVLASRCIAIPMRRSTRQMPAIPPNFDGSAIRHQLYTLMLTYFSEIYVNYFERPELHTLHNRSGELWSPLVALAAFFEEKGGITGLLDAISNAAEWEEQTNEGRSLNEREEAILQALEMITRGGAEITWVRAADLREKVCCLLGTTPEQMGNAQWVGHLLNRLQLTDNTRRRHYVNGKQYAIKREEVLDMIERYNVPVLEGNPSG